MAAYFNHTHEVLSMVPLLSGQPCLYVGSLPVMKQLLSTEGEMRMRKPEQLTAAVLWGYNLFSSNGDTWKRHRRVVAPALATPTYELVVKESISLYNDVSSAQGWTSDRTSFDIPDINTITDKFALIVIARCGFGQPMEWSSVQGDSWFAEAVTRVSETMIPRQAVPKWAYNLPVKYLQTLEKTWTDFGKFMHNLVRQRKQEIHESENALEDRSDIFTRLVAAGDSTGKYGLSAQEVISNTFLMMSAGHETTAKALMATLALLALHEQDQDRAYQEIIEGIPSDRDPTSDDIPRLTHLLACLREALRIFPPGFFLPREVTQDTLIEVTRPRKERLLIKRGTLLVVDMISIHHDPHVFPDPDAFRPSRWYDKSEYDTSMFGEGPRACFGRKFAQVEAMTFLVLFLRDWKVECVEGYDKKRMLDEAQLRGIGFGMGSWPLRIVARK
ncbi:uncharacterized protein ARMOST_11346 [Armillaria ostoyae]|uniref:Cytochrome P450 n=1 Tax=Armillaria ostoyae TaxID=47428 RepID=A0A284RGX6_ARMOS|nr:uncharacterized protein ARMOST_11346 [Armillaria ostoyae]